VKSAGYDASKLPQIARLFTCSRTHEGSEKNGVISAIRRIAIVKHVAFTQFDMTIIELKSHPATSSLALLNWVNRTTRNKQKSSNLSPHNAIECPR
jgi:hypothetical protein